MGKLSTITLFILLLHSCTQRTPEKILEQQFNVSLKNFTYIVETFEEQWNPNGDGYVLIIFNFSELTKQNINYLKSLHFNELPIQKNNVIPSRFLFDKGYYSFINEDVHDERDFRLFIVDTKNNKAILYYQYM
jgi:ABC-type sulfate transport system substrate-binding protein